jgi:hypothetical protein
LRHHVFVRGRVDTAEAPFDSGSGINSGKSSVVGMMSFSPSPARKRRCIMRADAVGNIVEGKAAAAAGIFDFLVNTDGVGQWAAGFCGEGGGDDEVLGKIVVPVEQRLMGTGCDRLLASGKMVAKFCPLT